VLVSSSRSSARASAVALALVAALGGCGQAKKAAPPVSLSVDEPVDMAIVRSGSVMVTGSVRPATARVAVEGHDARVSGGRFSARVPLLPGTNLVDVVAGAPRARPDMVAIRVSRLVTVAVPDLGGYTPSDAKDALASLGLRADVQKAGGILEFLLPVDARVCDTEPPAGTQVAPGSSVTVHAAKEC
jgi:hypothetical protein